MRKKIEIKKHLRKSIREKTYEKNNNNKQLVRSVQQQSDKVIKPSSTIWKQLATARSEMMNFPRKRIQSVSVVAQDNKLPMQSVQVH